MRHAWTIFRLFDIIVKHHTEHVWSMVIPGLCCIPFKLCRKLSFLENHCPKYR